MRTFLYLNFDVILFCARKLAEKMLLKWSGEIDTCNQFRQNLKSSQFENFHPQKCEKQKCRKKIVRLAIVRKSYT